MVTKWKVLECWYKFYCRLYIWKRNQWMHFQWQYIPFIIKKWNIIAYSTAFCSCLYYHTETNGKRRTHGRSASKYPWLGWTLPFLSLDQSNFTYHRSNHWCLNFSLWVHASDVFCVFSMFKASVDLSRLYWIYDLLLHTPL